MSGGYDEGAATAVVAAVLPTARAGPPGWRRLREPRTGPGASAPGGRAGSGGYDEGAAAAVGGATLPTARAGQQGWRRRREPGPGASTPGGRAGSGAPPPPSSPPPFTGRRPGPGRQAGRAASPAPIRARLIARLLDWTLFCMSCSGTG
jgi:hypothetical protein